MPRFQNYVYKIIKKGEHFGHLELSDHKIIKSLNKKRDEEVPKDEKELPIRRFTC